ncbi:DUF4350 domain-containing protein [Pseudarthrobacter sp. J1738]|uniref:DUF4350 domain-containing protein n=1 Tax=Pseudarthrobacter sp. J1738 TaxID=3420446 RepID=UPI003D26E25A
MSISSPFSKALAWVRRHLLWIIISGFLLGAAIIFFVIATSPTPDASDLSLKNPKPNGAMALGEVLKKHQVDVKGPDSFKKALVELDSASQESTTFLYDPRSYLDKDQLLALASRRGKIVVVTPSLASLKVLAPEIFQAGVLEVPHGSLNPRCSAEIPQRAGNVQVHRVRIYRSATACYGSADSSPHNSSEDSGSATGMYATSKDGQVTVLGSKEILMNEFLAQGGNASLVINSLGSTEKLVWVTPDFSDVTHTSKPKTVTELMPDWVNLVGFWVMFLGVLAMLWRGRRLGPLALEPLPVVVKSSETVDGRARLYQQSNSLDRAASNLRSGTLSRLASQLHLGPHAPVASVVEAVSRHLGRPETDVSHLLTSYRPATDADLTRWAQELNALEKEVLSR